MEEFVPPTNAYKIRIRTDSADHNALMLMADGELVAILVELADETHGAACGQWTIEATFGLNSRIRPAYFASAAAAAGWVSEHICNRPFTLGPEITEIR
jgi:hypothetical protein